MEICILGGGHGCYAAAADLALQGHQVRFWRRNRESLRNLQSTGQIRLKDSSGVHDVKLAVITDRIEEAITGAELIVIPLPATSQSDLAQLMAPHLSTGQVVFLPPGSFGTFAMSREVRRLGNDADVAWAETGTLPYLARKHAENEVNVSVRAVRLPTGVYPARLAAHAMPILQKAYPSVIPCENGLSAALLNAGPIIHPPLMIMNAAPLEHFDKWDIHNEGTQPSVRAVTDQLDRERILIRETLGYMSNHFPLSDHYNSDRWMYGDAHKTLVKSGDWREKIDLYHHRYVLEDIEIGLVFFSSIAEYLKIKTPVIDGILALTSAFLKRDLKSSGRSFKTMGLDKYSLKELDHLLFVGEG